MGAFHLSQNWKFWRIFQTLCLSYLRIPLIKISARLNNILGSKGPNKPKRDHFMTAESIRKMLKIFNFSTTNAMLMKLTIDIYLNNAFHLVKSWGKNHRVEEGINKTKTHKMSKKINFFHQVRPFLNTFITVQDFKKTDNILANSSQKITPKQPKMTVSAGSKTFENSNSKNYNLITPKLAQYV